MPHAASSCPIRSRFPSKIPNCLSKTHRNPLKTIRKAPKARPPRPRHLQERPQVVDLALHVGVVAGPDDDVRPLGRREGRHAARQGRRLAGQEVEDELVEGVEDAPGPLVAEGRGDAELLPARLAASRVD